MSIWAGIFAPKGTSKPIIDKLAAALDKTLDDSRVAAEARRARRIDPAQERAHAGEVRPFVKGGDRPLVAHP